VPAVSTDPPAAAPAAEAPPPTEPEAPGHAAPAAAAPPPTEPEAPAHPPMPDGISTKQVIHRGVTISLREGKSQACWRVFLPSRDFPGIPDSKREYLRQLGTAKNAGTPEKRKYAFGLALLCADALVDEFHKKQGEAQAKE